MSNVFSVIAASVLSNCFIITVFDWADIADLCTFEAADLCGYTQDKRDDMDWSQIRGDTSSTNTGPSNDHTYASSTGVFRSASFTTPVLWLYWLTFLCCSVRACFSLMCWCSLGKYLYIEASGKRKGSAARLSSPVIDQTGGACVEFWYHMYGKTTGNLTVSIIYTYDC